MMAVKEILIQLKSLSDEKMLKHNIRMGATEKNCFGVKMGDIRKIAAKIKADHALGLELWKTGNIDARQLAVLIMDPKLLSAKELETLVRSIDFSWLADWFNSYILKDHPEKEKLRVDWMKSDDKWLLRSAWSLTAGRIAKGAEGIDLAKMLDRIEKEMPEASPETQWTMNAALANIGIHHPAHRKRAIEIGNKLGIYKDYPVSKGCTSPFAPIWINEMVNRQTKDKKAID
jgi:3-methyladenine DNA glycosylase AlkD